MDSIALRWFERGRYLLVRSKPAGEQEHDKHDQDDADYADAAMTITIAIAAEAPAESAKQEDDKEYDEYKSDRHCSMSRWFRNLGVSAKR